jgi:hypothetical protein
MNVSENSITPTILPTAKPARTHDTVPSTTARPVGRFGSDLTGTIIDRGSPNSSKVSYIHPDSPLGNWCLFKGAFYKSNLRSI